MRVSEKQETAQLAVSARRLKTNPNKNNRLFRLPIRPPTTALQLVLGLHKSIESPLGNCNSHRIRYISVPFSEIGTTTTTTTTSSSCITMAKNVGLNHNLSGEQSCKSNTQNWIIKKITANLAVLPPNKRMENANNIKSLIALRHDDSASMRRDHDGGGSGGETTYLNCDGDGGVDDDYVIERSTLETDVNHQSLERDVNHQSSHRNQFQPVSTYIPACMQSCYEERPAGSVSTAQGVIAIFAVDSEHKWALLITPHVVEYRRHLAWLYRIYASNRGRVARYWESVPANEHLKRDLFNYFAGRFHLDQPTWCFKTHALWFHTNHLMDLRTPAHELDLQLRRHQALSLSVVQLPCNHFHEQHYYDYLSYQQQQQQQQQQRKRDKEMMHNLNYYERIMRLMKQECPICMEAKSLTCLQVFDCSHYVCFSCFIKIESVQCPICRRPIRISNSFLSSTPSITNTSATSPSSICTL